MKIKTISKSSAILLVVLAFACGKGETASEKSEVREPSIETNTKKQSPPVSEPLVDEKQVQILKEESNVGLTGEAKIGNSDCLSCHLVERKVVGPAFKEIAAEYKPTDENITKLAKKVIDGGAGVWGEAAMPPHQGLSEEDAKDMIRYILSLYEE